ncbi:MAG TPA: AlkA N-terminal domain-containing protein [Ottowia sp.]|uniref:DNA-3-methyladenine glycosylase family protein n=1 Tax=Ottowia sp. TaxID=1898956 RepID=UPI002BCF63A9|nr:AlkA N-terminal domain-containing protein [Ottowia sp.]HMN21277.1 AlkA N-terminal domain-containing protein [Ottowia sp.]
MPADHLTLDLSFQPPLDWSGLCRFLAARAIPGVESVQDGVYRRAVRLPHGGQWVAGWLALAAAGPAGTLRLTLPASLAPLQDRVVVRLRRLFDLDRDPAPVAAGLGALGAAHPGVRVPGAFDGFETVVRAILGQQVTVAAASTLAGRLARQFGVPLAIPLAGLTHAFPDAATLAAADRETLGRLGIVRTRVAAIQGLAQAVAQGLVLAPGADVPATLRALQAIRGIGDWTAQYAAMRALKWADAFPAADHGVLTALGLRTAAQARAAAERWRPWRAYAVMCLWQSLG